ncbi:MAG: type II toxin-antitoxin system RelE/ParE family toxin [Pseudonocardia sp.]|nr:type II toxin-antitoxin system RelE/ParE family toxin [Pseudonocardia sp.]
MTEAHDLYELRMAASAERALARLAPKAAAAIVEFALGPLRESPRRVGKPLVGEQAGRWSARRGPYRLIYEIDEEKRVVRVLHAAHRADVYRPD